MTGLKLYITSNSDKEYTDNKERVFTGAVHRLYKQREMLSDSDFINDLKKELGYTDIEIRSLKSRVSGCAKSKSTWETKNLERAEDIFEILSEKGFENKHTAFKKRKQAFRLIKSSEKEIYFGDMSILKKLSKECNKKERDEEYIEELRKQLKESRNIGFDLMGEGNQKCNRHVDLSHLSEGIVILKIERKHKVELRFNPEQYKNRIYVFKKIEEQAKLKQDEGEIPVSFHMCQNYMTLTFDEEKLNEWGIEEKNRKKEVNKVKEKKLPKKEEESQIKNIYKKYYDIQEELKLKEKNKNVFMAVDQNPYYLSYAVIKMDFNEETGEYSYIILKCGYFDLYQLNSKKGYASDSKKAKRLTNKRHFELSIIVKKMFGICRHYNCGSFVLEDLDFKPHNADVKTRESNRQINNIWCRTYFEKYVTRRCNETGTILKKVLPCLTSFIGNIQHDYNDPVNAAIEIARRGALQYKTGCTYPQLTGKDIVTLGTLFGDGVLPRDSYGNIDMTAGVWKSVYNSAKSGFEQLKDFSHRWRKRLQDAKHLYRKRSMDSWRSCVLHIEYLNDKSLQKPILGHRTVNDIDFQ